MSWLDDWRGKRLVEANAMVDGLLIANEDQAREIRQLRGELEATQSTLRQSLARATTSKHKLDRLAPDIDDIGDPIGQPTPRQWVNRFLRASDSVRVSWAATAMANADTAERCHQRCHEDRIEALTRRVLTSEKPRPARAAS